MTVILVICVIGVFYFFDTIKSFNDAISFKWLPKR